MDKPKLPAPPGSLTQSWRYLQGGRTLIVSGRAWNIPGLCKHFGVKPPDICWPSALCLATNDQSRLARCDKYGKPNHGPVGKGAHILLDLSKLDSFWRLATAEEKQGLVSAMQVNASPDAGGKGRGRGSSRGRGPSRGRGRGGQHSGLFDDMDDVDDDDDDGAAFLALTHRGGAGRQGDGKRPRAPSPSVGNGPADHPPFVLLGRDLSSFRAGQADAVASAPIDTLPSPKAPASAATQRNALHSPMRTLAAHLLNEGRLLIDVGGQGQCGPNTLSFQIGLLDSVLKLGAPDGPTLRAACCKHVLDRDVQRRVTSLTDEYGMPMLLGQLVIDAMLHWPSCSFDGDVSVENWCKMISKPETWTDIAFLQIVSDVCGVAIHVTGVSDLSEVIRDMLLILPCDRKPPKALLRVGYWLDRHLVAIVDLEKEKGAAPADLPDGRPPPPPGPACSAADPPSPPAFQPRPTSSAAPLDEDGQLFLALSNSELTLEGDEVRRAISITTAADSTESQRYASAVEIQAAIEASIADEKLAASQAASEPAAAWHAEPSVAVAEYIMQQQSLSQLQTRQDADELWARGEDTTTAAALLLSSRFSAPLDIRPSVPPAPAPAEADDIHPSAPTAPAPADTDEEWGDWTGGYDSDDWGEYSRPSVMAAQPAGAPSLQPTPPAPPPPADAPAGSRLSALLQELQVCAAPAPPPTPPAEITQTRVPRVGFSEHADHARPPGNPEMVMSRTFTKPADLAAFLASASLPPTELVGFEFSGAVLLARRVLGVVAISADTRPAEHDGLHYLGCVQDIISLRVWDRVYLFPPCFQHLLGDVDCLEAKLRDGRAFWAGALVLWCVCVASAVSVLVEQPDTLFHHILDMSTYPGVTVVETSTSALGDIDRKFLRLTLRNFALPTLTDYNPPPLPRQHHQHYLDPDLRDRARSSWSRFPFSSAALAGLDTLHSSPVAIDYTVAISDFAARWHAAGLAVPHDYENHDGRPTSASDRRYQLRRGPGDGRVVDAVTPVADADRHAVASGYLSHLLPSCDEAVHLPTTTSSGHTILHVPILHVQTGAGEWLNQSPPPADLEGSTEHAPPNSSAAAPDLTSSHPSITFVDIRNATEATACILFISVLVQPLILAHANGFTVHGAVIPAATRSTAMTAMQKIVNACCAITAYIAYMVGLYVGGARVFAAPIDFRPPDADICHTPAQRRARIGVSATFVWCTLAALADTPIFDVAQRAVASAHALIKPVEHLADYPSTDGVVFQTGVSSSTSVLRRPISDDPSAPAVGQAISRLSFADRLLAEALQRALTAGEPYLDGWAEQIRPLPIDEVPEKLLHALPDYHDDRLSVIPFAPVLVPLRTAWYPRPPRQPTPPPEAPACVRSVWDLYTELGRSTAQTWFARARDDMLHIRDRLHAGAPPAEISRDRPAVAVLGQELETQPWARGLVWDCSFRRSECCVPLDFHEPIESHLDLTYLGARLRHYPDQTLVANVLEGVRLDADTELQNVNVPHLSSLPFGYTSVEKELRRLQGLGWYSFHAAPPYYPMYFNGQGAVPRKLEPDRYRRSTEGGGPRRPTVDASGLQALSINEASHIHHMPRHFLSDSRPEFRAWLSERGLPAARDVQTADGERATKWPKERKPTITQVARALSILCAAAAFIATPASPSATYVVGDDFKDYFNQLVMAPSERHKLGVVFLARSAAEAHADGPAADTPPWLGGTEPLNFISEKQLGFGTHGASNIAQRFSDSLLDLFREDMDAAEAPVVAAAQGTERAWLERRLELQRRKGEPCVAIHRHTAPPESQLPDIPAPPQLDAIPPGYVCPQLRLYAAFCYTDDPLFTAVGVDRTLRLIRTWRRLTTKAGLIMAIPEKRSLGSWGQWLGVMVVGALGILVVPRAKLLRAREVIVQALRSTVEFHEYRSLCGLLEHLRAIVMKGRHIMHGLYRPHGPDGASRYGPNGVVDVDDLMNKQLHRWLTLLAEAGGVSAKRALLREDLDPSIDWHIDASSDACLADVYRAGIGGYCHGIFWYIAVPEEDRQYFAIPALEFMGVAFNILFLHALLAPSVTAAQGKVMVNLRTDALTTSLTLPAESMGSPALVAAYQALISTTAWLELSPYLRIAHAFDHTNTGADLVSRAKWTEFYQLCRQLGVRPSWRAVPAEAADIYSAARLRPRSPPVKFTNGVEVIEYMSSLLKRLRADALHSEDPLPSPPAPLPRAHGASHSPTGLARRLLSGFASTARQPSAGPSPAFSTVNSNPIPPQSALLQRLRAGSTTDATAPRLPSLHAELAEPERPASHLPTRRPYPTTASDLVSSSSSLIAAVRAGSASLPMPTPVTLEITSSPSRLAVASRHYSRARALALTEGDDPSMALRLSVSQAILSSAEIVESYLEFGVNHATGKKDARAWEMWEVVCAMLGTSPLRTAPDARDRPERNAHLLAVLMFYAVSVCKPRISGRRWIKPGSALAYPLAIIRIFARWSIPMPGYKLLKAAAAGLARDYIRYHGPHSLAPVRAEPMKFAMVRDMCNIPTDGRAISAFTWTDTSHEVFVFRRLVRVLMFSGLRLGEIVGNGSGEVTYITLDCVAWRINGVIVKNPTAAQLHSLRPGRDAAIVSPPRSKPDQWGEIHCPFPMIFTFDDRDPINAASAIRDVELRYGLSCSRRDTTPLFATAEGRVYTHHYLDRLLRNVLAHLYGERVASIYSFHSFRSGLATALHAAGVEDSMIMLICRWMCPESLHVYRRMGTAEHERLIAKAARVRIDAIQSANVAAVAGCERYADIMQHVSAPTRETQRAYAAAAAGRDDDISQPTSDSSPPSLQLGSTSRGTAPGEPLVALRTGTAPLPAKPTAGDRVIIPACLWPQYRCRENDGLGWSATVVSATAFTALVRFASARTRAGQPYQDERLPWNRLCLP